MSNSQPCEHTPLYNYVQQSYPASGSPLRPSVLCCCKCLVLCLHSTTSAQPANTHSHACSILTWKAEALGSHQSYAAVGCARLALCGREGCSHKVPVEPAHVCHLVLLWPRCGQNREQGLQLGRGGGHGVRSWTWEPETACSVKRLHHQSCWGWGVDKAGSQRQGG